MHHDHSGFVIGVITLGTVLLVLISALLGESRRNLDPTTTIK